MFTRLRYLVAQWRHGRGKRRKDATFRLGPAINLVIASTALQPGARILCVGPRNQTELRIWREHGFTDVTGLDLFPADPGIDRGDFHRLPYATGSFDLIFASHAYEHALNPERALSEALRVLRLGGHVYAAFPIGFMPNSHDRWDYGSIGGFISYMPKVDFRLVWSATKDGECRLLLRVEG